MHDYIPVRLRNRFANLCKGKYVVFVYTVTKPFRGSQLFCNGKYVMFVYDFYGGYVGHASKDKRGTYRRLYDACRRIFVLCIHAYIHIYARIKQYAQVWCVYYVLFQLLNLSFMSFTSLA